MLIRNDRLEQPGVLGWAFTTTHVSHFQPLSWLAWAATRRAAGSGPAAHHALSWLFHLLNAGLVYALAGRFFPEAKGAAAVAALVFSIHPLRVETVAWASAAPYVLSLSFTLLSVLLYLGSGSTLRYLASVGAYAVSLLLRPLALGLPLVLFAIDFLPGRATRRPLAGKLPFFILAAVALALEWRARPFASLVEFGWGARLTLAVSAPFLYLARTLAPMNLTPLDPLPLRAETSWPVLIAASAALVGLSGVLWRRRGRWPEPLSGWFSYLVLLIPALGLAPSGLQATADRYTYLPGVVLGLLAGGALSFLWSEWPRRRTGAAILAGGILVLLGAQSWRQTGWWQDSISLWTRAVAVDPRNDVALYNLATALAEAGREEEAIARYEELLRLLPEHAPARQNLNLLRAQRLEHQAGRLAASGRLEEAAGLYQEALELDPARLHSRASRGVALAHLGRAEEAIPDLEMAWKSGAAEPEVPNALGFALASLGRDEEASELLRAALARFPEDLNLAHNWARLLATSENPRVRDGERALEMALRLVEKSGGKDPRLLDTLAAAYAAVGQLAEAAETEDRATALARAAGDSTLAAELAARGRFYRARGPGSR